MQGVDLGSGNGKKVVVDILGSMKLGCSDYFRQRRAVNKELAEVCVRDLKKAEDEG